MKKVYNESKTEILTEFDLEKGYLTSDVITTHYPAVQAVEEVGHYETVCEYENGGKDVEYIIDTPAVQAVEEHDETEEIDVYDPTLTLRGLQILYTKNKRNKPQIKEFESEEVPE